MMHTEGTDHPRLSASRPAETARSEVALLFFGAALRTVPREAQILLRLMPEDGAGTTQVDEVRPSQKPIRAQRPTGGKQP